MPLDWKAIGLVSAGAVPGALLRWGVSVLIPSTALPWPSFPWATLAVNLVGAFAIGWLVLPAGAEQATRYLIVIGFLGAFTTLSTYSVETVELWRFGHRDLALLNIALNGVGGPLMALAGWQAGARIAP